jgi:cytochrome c
MGAIRNRHFREEPAMKWMVTVVAVSALVASGAASAQEDLAKKDGCMNCHDVSAKKVGPAFKEVAAKYKGKGDAEANLFTKLKEGKGHPATKASDNDLKGIVKWVLSQ